jgi:hypothetical protein
MASDADVLYAVAGLSQLTFIPFFLNQEVVVLAKFEMKSMLEAVTKYKVNEMWLVPRKSTAILPARKLLTVLGQLSSSDSSTIP